LFSDFCKHFGHPRLAMGAMVCAAALSVGLLAMTTK
jgi:hypothetical protein